MSDSSSSIRRDIASAYVVTAARVLGWVVVSGVIFRNYGAVALGLITLIRATIGILSYTSLGLGPALVRKFAEISGAQVTERELVAEAMEIDRATPPPVLDYASTSQFANPTAYRMLAAYTTGNSVATLCGIVALAVSFLYASQFYRLHEIYFDRSVGELLVTTFGFGTVMRLLSEPASALLQSRGKIALDNSLVAIAEVFWAAASVVALLDARSGRLQFVGILFAIVSTALLFARRRFARWEGRKLLSQHVPSDSKLARELIAFGSLIVISQVADFLYAPTDCLLINHLIGAEAVAWYSPAIQIDAGLLLLVSGLAAALYPHSSIAHAAGDVPLVRRYYLRGTLASFALLTVAGLAVWALSPFIFKIWFGEDLPQTREILPLLLIHTVVGGSSAVGRSVLLAAGKVKPFTIAVLIAGVSNVILSYIFVRHLHLGLKGIVLGTIIVVVARAGIWMPWYVLRTLRQEKIAG